MTKQRKGTRGSLGDPEADMDARQALLEGSLPQVFATYDDALDEGIGQPVVLLLDCEDEIGGPMARDWVGDREVDLAIEENRHGEPIITTLARALAYDDCRDAVAHSFPYLLASFDAPPESGFLTIVVAAGGAGTFTVPFSARPEL